MRGVAHSVRDHAMFTLPGFFNRAGGGLGIAAIIRCVEAKYSHCSVLFIVSAVSAVLGSIFSQERDLQIQRCESEKQSSAVVVSHGDAPSVRLDEVTIAKLAALISDNTLFGNEHNNTTAEVPPPTRGAVPPAVETRTQISTESA